MGSRAQLEKLQSSLWEEGQEEKGVRTQEGDDVKCGVETMTGQGGRRDRGVDPTLHTPCCSSF